MAVTEKLEDQMSNVFLQFSQRIFAEQFVQNIIHLNTASEYKSCNTCQQHNDEEEEEEETSESSSHGGTDLGLSLPLVFLLLLVIVVIIVGSGDGLIIVIVVGGVVSSGSVATMTNIDCEAQLETIDKYELGQM